MRRGFRHGFTRPGLPRVVSRRELLIPVAVGGLCVLALAGVAASVMTVTEHLTSRNAAVVVNSDSTNTTRPAKEAAAARAGRGRVASPAASAAASSSAGGRRGGHAAGGKNGAGAGTGPARSRHAVVAGHTAPRTSCRSVAHFGDSTSEGLISSDYLPNRADRITARYATVGVTHSIMEIYGGTSIVETINGDPNADALAKQLVARGYHGCWVLALGINDTADVYAGSNVGRIQRIKEMMSVIGNQPVLWIAVKSLLSRGPYAEQNMLLWNQALAQEQSQYPNMRIYDWPAVAQQSWFINDGIHYTSYGYAQRARLIADALATAFPAGQPYPSARQPAAGDGVAVAPYLMPQERAPR